MSDLLPVATQALAALEQALHSQAAGRSRPAGRKQGNLMQLTVDFPGALIVGNVMNTRVEPDHCRQHTSQSVSITEIAGAGLASTTSMKYLRLL